MRIMVVGDKAVEEKQLKHIKELGHTVETVTTALGALKLVRGRNFDLILMELFLPDMEGSKIIPKIKKALPQVEIIATTSINSRELEAEARKHGISYYMIRPTDEKYLLTILEHIAVNLRLNDPRSEGQD